MYAPARCFDSMRHSAHGNPSPANHDESDDDERVLGERLQKRDPAAFRALAERHLRGLFNYAQRMLGNAAEAEDVTQETFLELWQRAESWEPRARLGTWLYRVAHNRSVDRLRQRRPAGGDVEQVPDSGRPSRAFEHQETAARVREALDALPDRQRSAVVMSHYAGMSNPEIARVLEVTVEAVEALLSRARRSLRDTLAPTKDSP